MLKLKPILLLSESHSALSTKAEWAFPHDRLDAANAPKLELELRSRLSTGPVALDLAAVRFADSSGLAVLVRCHTQWTGKLSLLNIHPSLARCLTRVPADKLPPMGDG